MTKAACYRAAFVLEKNILYPQLRNSRFGNERFAKQQTTGKAILIEEFGKDYGIYLQWSVNGGYVVRRL